MNVFWFQSISFGLKWRGVNFAAFLGSNSAEIPIFEIILAESCFLLMSCVSRQRQPLFVFERVFLVFNEIYLKGIVLC